MGALADSASLLRDPVWRDWVTAAAVEVATEVEVEGTGVTSWYIRKRLALDVLTFPDMVTTKLVSYTATDPLITAEGGTPVSAHEPLILDKVRDVWTTVARATYPTTPEEGP
jgi:hypothetical protein